MISHHFVELDELILKCIKFKDLRLFYEIIEENGKKLSRNKFTLYDFEGLCYLSYFFALRS